MKVLGILIVSFALLQSNSCNAEKPLWEERMEILCACFHDISNATSQCWQRCGGIRTVLVCAQCNAISDLDDLLVPLALQSVHNSLGESSEFDQFKKQLEAIEVMLLQDAIEQVCDFILSRASSTSFPCYRCKNHIWRTEMQGKLGL